MERLRNKVFPEAVRAECFGPNVKKFVSFKANGARPATEQYFSRIIFGNLTLEDKDGQYINESVVIKTQSEKSLFHSPVRIDSHFHNEILFYTEVIPSLQKYDTENILSKSVPDFLYGNTTNGQNPEEDVIILRDLHKKGFRMFKEGLFLDENHVKLILDRIAKYHALSFKFLHEDPKKFHDIVSRVQEVFHDEPRLDILSRYSSNLLKFRGIEPLASNPKYRDRLGDIYKHCEKGYLWMYNCTQPSKPLSVLVHGELTGHNLMFRYSSDGQPEEVVLLDWGMMKFCSPIVDVSFLLMLHTSPELKRLKWDEFIQTYYNTMSLELAGYPAKPSFEEIESEMQKKGIYGYHWSSFMLPGYLETTMKENLTLLDPESRSRFWMECGGTKATEYLTEIVKHMLDRNFVFEH